MRQIMAICLQIRAMRDPRLPAIVIEISEGQPALLSAPTDEMLYRNDLCACDIRIGTEYQ